MNQHPKSSLENFNPFETHFFTNGSGLTPRSPLPTQYPAPMPSPHVRTYHPESISPAYSPSDTSSIASTDSNSSSRNSTPLHSPKPRAPSMAPPPPRQIFVTFRKDAATPELVLKKRPPVQSNVVSRPK